MNESHTTYASAGVGASGAVCLSWLVSTIFHVEMPPAVAISMASLASMVTGYFLHQIQSKGAVVK